MDRRKALKGLGLSLGTMVATPTIISLLQSCKTKATSWTPIFVTSDEGTVIRNLVDLILPTTSGSPGALDVNVPEFLDLYISKGVNEEDQKQFKLGMSEIINELTSSGKSISTIKTSDYDVLLAKYLKASSDEKKQFKTNETNSVVLNAVEGCVSN